MPTKHLGMSKAELMRRLNEADFDGFAPHGLPPELRQFYNIIVEYIDNIVPDGVMFPPGIHTVSEMRMQEMVVEDVPYFRYGRRMIVDPLISIQEPRRLVGFQWGLDDIATCGYLNASATNGDSKD